MLRYVTLCCVMLCYVMLCYVMLCYVVPKENSLKKNYGSEFLQSSFIFVICLLKEVNRKIMSEIYFEGKTRYEDLT